MFRQIIYILVNVNIASFNNLGENQNAPPVKPFPNCKVSDLCEQLGQRIRRYLFDISLTHLINRRESRTLEVVRFHISDVGETPSSTPDTMALDSETSI